MTYLDAIVAQRRHDIRNEKRFVPLEALQQMAIDRSDIRDFAGALETGRPSIVAEIKRASPSAGPINPFCDVAAAAADFERGGAAALSVLTEPRSFDGSFLDLQVARRATKLPLLCKDFVIDDFQIWKAAAFGADAVLLIAAILGDATLRSFLELADTLHMDAILEVHDEAELARSVALGSRIIGINNRHLQSFQVDVATATRLCSRLRDGHLIVAESGYQTAAQVQNVYQAGAHAVLVGESLMRSADRAMAVRSLGSFACSP